MKQWESKIKRGILPISFSISAGVSTAAIYITLLFLVLGFLKNSKGFLIFLKEKTVAAVILSFSSYILFHVVYLSSVFPHTYKVNWDYGLEAFLVSGVPAILFAWYLVARSLGFFLVLIGYSFGLIAILFFYLGWNDLMVYLIGKNEGRLFFGNHKNAISFFYGLAFLSWVTVIWHSLNQNIRGFFWLWKILIWIAYLLISALLILVVFWTQTRSSWVALIAAGGFVLSWTLVRNWKSLQPHGRAVVVFAPFVVVTILGVLNSQMLASRWEESVSDISRIVESEIDASSPGSVGARFLMMKAGGEAFQERPWLGWGEGGYGRAVMAGGYPELRKWPHFHNLYLQILVGYGLVGFAGFLCLALMVLREVVKGYQYRVLEFSEAAFLLSGWVYFGIISLAQIRHNDPQGKAVLILLLGLTLSVAVRNWCASSRNHKEAKPCTG